MAKAKKLMGLREYARHRGVSLAAVQDAISKNKIDAAISFKGTLKKIDPVKADELWLANTVPNNKNQNTLSSAQASSPGPNYATARAVKESYAAKNEQLKYEEKAGKLCNSEAVGQAARDLARLTREALEMIPNKLSPLLAAETDINKVHKVLKDEIHQACENLSNGNWAWFKGENE